MNTKRRATEKDEIGVNGEIYQKGQFLPSTTLPKGINSPKKKVSKPRREEIAPYIWGFAPEGMRSIYTLFNHMWKKDGENFKIIDNLNAEYFGENRIKTAIIYVEKWNNGDRWMPIDNSLW